MTWPGSLETLATNHSFGETIAASTDNDQARILNALMATLGVNPQGGYATVAARFSDIATARGLDPYDFGAVGDNSTDDTAAIQACRDAAAVNGYAVQFRPVKYVCSGLTHDTTGFVDFRGVAAGGSGAFGALTTVLRRASGTTPILAATGTDQGSGRSRLNIRDIAFDGGGTAGDVVVLTRTSDGLFPGVTISNAAGSGLVASQVWDSTFIAPHFHSVGNGTTKPALDLTGINEANGGCSAVKVFGGEWNGCTGIERRFGDGAVANIVADKCIFVGSKLEREDLGSFPMTDLANAQGLAFVAEHSNFTDGSDDSQFVEMTDRGNGIPCIFVAPTFDHSGSPANFVEQTAANSTLLMQGASLIGTPTNKLFHIGVNVFSFDLAGLHHSCSTALRFADDRTNTGELGKGYRDIERYGNISTAAATASVGSWLVYDFLDAATNDWVGVIQVPQDCVPGSTAVLRCWYTGSFSPGANQVVVLNWLSQAQSAPGSLAAGSTTYAQNITIPSGFTVNTLNSQDISGPAINPGQALQVRLQRLGADAADTYTGNWRLLRAELVYTKTV